MNEKHIQTAVPIELFQVSNLFQEVACRLPDLPYFSIQIHSNSFSNNNAHIQRSLVLEIYDAYQRGPY